MQDLSKILSVATVLGLMGIYSVAMTHPAVTPNIAQPVGVIETFQKTDLKRPSNHGSGTFISPTVFLTAGHVVFAMEQPGTVARIRMEDGSTYKIIKIQHSKEFDISVVTVDHPYGGYIPQINCTKQARGTELVTIGNPLEMEFLESKIIVSGGQVSPVLIDTEPKKGPEDNSPGVTTKNFPGTDDNEPHKGFDRIPPNKITPQEKKEPEANLNGAAFFQGPSLPGQSGSPLFDRDGNLVGVLIISIVDERNGSYSGLGMYVQASDACQFLKDSIK